MLALLFVLDVPYAVPFGIVWFLAADRVWPFVWGSPSELSERERDAALLKTLQSAQNALISDYIPVAVYRHTLVTAVANGVGWNEAARRLLADAARRRDRIWRVPPEYT